MSNLHKSNSFNPLSFFSIRSFRGQVTALMLLLLLIAFALFVWHSSYQKKLYITQSIESTGGALAQKLSHDAETYFLENNFAEMDALLLQYANFPNVVDLSVETIDGSPISQVTVVDGEPVIQYTNSLEGENKFSTSTNNMSVVESIKIGTRTVGFVRLTLNLNQAIHQTRLLLINSLFYAILICILFLSAISLYFERPMKSIREASSFAATLDEKRGESLIVPTFAKEFEQLGLSLNSVSQKLLEQEKQVEAANSEAKKLALVASKTNTSVIITNVNRKVEWVNESFEKITGYCLDQVKGKDPSEFLNGKDTDPKTIAYIAEEASQGRGCEVELLNYRKDGQSYWANASIQPVFDDNGEINSYISIETDITQRKEAEVELYEAKVEAEKANLAKSEFLSRMSHELRTPLNAILGFAQILQMDELNEEQDDSVNRILKAGKHLLALINEVLEISRIESGGFALSIESVAIQESVEDVLRLAQPLATEFDINLVCDESLSTNYIIMGDLQRINQVLLNLVSNAIKYNRPNGTVTISSEEQENGRLRIFVEDTGHGIEEDKLDRLFIPFDRLGAEQTTIEGSGIGLALTKQLLNIMDGTIGVSSVAGEGTTFWFEMPISEVKAVEAVANLTTPFIEANAANEDGNPTIVYIEDNLSNVALVERVMDRMGNIDLQVALQGQEGLELVERQHPDLVLLDLHLPLLGGEVILERLKQHDEMKSIPVIIVSADATPKHIQRLLDKGADDYLTKPLDVQELADQVHKYLGA